MSEKERIFKEQIIQAAKTLYLKGLVVGRSGNLSIALDEENILITASGTYLGELEPLDIVRINLSTGAVSGQKEPSSELALHSLVHKNFSQKAVIHSHPPLTNGYFSVEDSLEILTFESRLYLGEIPVIKQEAPIVTNPEEVVSALRKNNLVVLKNHGVIAMGEDFREALSFTEVLEEGIKTALVAKIFKKEASKKEEIEEIKLETKFPMFSKEHIQAIVDLVNKDEFIAAKGKELDLTLKLAIKLEGTDKVYRFNFEKGKIADLGFDAQAPFVISAPKEVWEEVFLGRLDPFVATTQKKMKLEGQLAVLARWYVVFNRLFQIFKQVEFSKI